MKKTVCTLKETTANTTIKPDLQAALRQMAIGKNANAVGWVIVTMYIFGPAPRELTSQECRKARELFKHFNIPE